MDTEFKLKPRKVKDWEGISTDFAGWT